MIFKDVPPNCGTVTFFPASIDEIRDTFSEFTEYWKARPGALENPREWSDDSKGSDYIFEKVFDGDARPSYWNDLLLPQNYDCRLLFVDVDLPGWCAVVDEYQSTIRNHVPQAYGTLANSLKQEAYHGVDTVPDFTAITIEHDFEREMLSHPVGGHHTYLNLAIASTRITFPWAKNSVYDRNVPWYSYGCRARGWHDGNGLDVPVAFTHPGRTSPEIPDYLRTEPQDVLSFDFTWEDYGWAYDREKHIDDHVSILPFDPRGKEKVTDFFSTSIISNWLQTSFGIRWDDPTFYEGESLLYVVGKRGEITDPLTPRIPLETFERYQGFNRQKTTNSSPTENSDTTPT